MTDRSPTASAPSDPYAGATVLAVIKKRWDVTFCLRLADGTETDLIASADAYYTDHDSIWFGTREEHADA